MNLHEAENLALELMIEHKLYDWSFIWHNRKRSLGTCYYSRKQIALSKVITAQLSEKEIKNTILHEIAHALVGHGHGHDFVWQRKAMEIGCNGNRCSDIEIDVQAKYVGICPKCGKKFNAHRRPKRDHWCRCTGRTFKQEEKINYVQQY